MSGWGSTGAPGVKIRPSSSTTTDGTAPSRATGLMNPPSEVTSSSSPGAAASPGEADAPDVGDGADVGVAAGCEGEELPQPTTRTAVAAAMTGFAIRTGTGM